MDTEKCEVLLCALECGSLSAAAERMGYSPSGVSRVVNSMEEVLGVPLLLREHSGVHATQACRELLPVIQELAHWGKRCEEVASHLKGLDIGSITVGSAYHICDRWLAGLVAEFGRIYPSIRVHIMEGTSSRLAELLDRGEVDFAVVSRREGRFLWKMLYRDRLTAWVPHGHPAEAAGSFSQSWLKTACFVELYPGQETDNSRFLAEQGICPDVRYATSDVYTACAMVETGLGIALVNGLMEPIMGGRVASVPIEPSYYVDIGIATQLEENISPAARCFAEFAAKRIENLKKDLLWR